MSGFRDWMYPHWDKGGLRAEFADGVVKFLDFAFSEHGRHGGGKISCPCVKCRNCALRDYTTVTAHLYRSGFMPDYTIWTSHGETYDQFRLNGDWGESSNPNGSDGDDDNAYMDMVHDTFPQFNNEEDSQLPEEPNAKAKAFYELIHDADQPIWPGHNKTTLEWVTEIMSYKSSYRVSQAATEKFVQSGRSMAPAEHQHSIPDSFRKIKKIMMKLGLSVIKYDVCPNHCFLYYKEGETLIQCPVCELSRYKPSKSNATGKNIARKKLWYFPVTERLQRLYMSRKTAEHMTWHTKCKPGAKKVIHPAGSQAWHTLNETYPDFASETRNVRLGLSSDDFDPNKGSAATPHSIWPVFVTPYNLPPNLAMRQEFIFLSLLIAGPDSPGKSIDVMLRPLIDELKSLWNDGVVTYDSFRKQNFIMKAAVIWTISDIPAYGMLSGWSTHGRLACPCCMENTDSYRLVHGGKPTWFDCHRKFLPERHPERKNKKDYLKDRVVVGVCYAERFSTVEVMNRVNSLPEVTFGLGYKKLPGFGRTHNWTKRCIFWELPYWSSLLVRHNLDVMHIEKNVFENICHTVFDDPNTSKDNLNARRDLENLTTRKSLFLKDDTGKKPKATYTLDANQRRAVLEWLKSLRFPDGYASNVGNYVKLKTMRLSEMKSHDCHVFMQRLLPIAFRDFLPKPIWDALTELSCFFRSICTNEISPVEMYRLSFKIIETVCKLEKIFPPGFFDSMEHLVVHLPYESMVAGPVFYRWMYPFERMMWQLKNNYMNKNRLEGSICEAYLMREVSNFCSFYFGRDLDAPPTRVRRNEILPFQPQVENQLPIFIPKGETIAKGIESTLSPIDFNAAILYIIQNCPEVEQYVNMFEAQFEGRLNARELEHKRVTEMLPWLRKYSRSSMGETMDNRLSVLLCGASQRVRKYGGYVVNGLRFHTKAISDCTNIMCCGVSLMSSDTTYYGMIHEVVEISFYGLGFPEQKIVMFKCDWFDPTKGVKVCPKTGLVDIDSNKRFATAEPFILAEQATQVYFAEYPSSKLPRGTRKGIWSVCPVRARHIVDISAITTTEPNDTTEVYQDPHPPPPIQLTDELTSFDVRDALADSDVGLIEIPDEPEDDVDDDEEDANDDEEDDEEDDDNE